MVGGQSIASTRKTVVDKIFLQDTTSWHETIVGKGASQVYLYFVSINANWSVHEMGDSIGTLQIFTAYKKTRNFGNVVKPDFQRVRPQCKVESFYTTSTQKKMMHIVLADFVDTATLCLKQWDGIINFAYDTKLVFLSLKKKFNEALKKEN